MALFEDMRFRLFTGITSSFTTQRNSLSDRLSNINVQYFEAIFKHINQIIAQQNTKNVYNSFKIQRFDSTLVGLSAKILSDGMTMGRKKKDQEQGFKFIKFTIGFNGLGIDQLVVNTTQNSAAEEVALTDAIQKTSVDAKSIVVFDRGLKKRKTFAEFSLAHRSFITRINPTQSYKIVQEKTDSIGKRSTSLEIVSERYIRFHNGGVSTKKAAPFWRLIVCKHLKTGQLYYFLSNLFDMSALDITEIYRLRWDIEVFFRFLKQELNFSHFLSRSLNGIKVMVYMTLIAALMLLLYKQKNQLTGYKMVKLKFANELQTDLIKEIVIYCGGNPDKLKDFKPH